MTKRKAPYSPDRRSVLAGLAAAPIALAATGAAARHRPSAVGLGSWITFNVGDNPALLRQSTDVIRAFVDAGGGMIDSSPMYGTAQHTIGHALDQLGRPAGVYSADKVWTTGDGAAQIAATRRLWGVPRFDLLQVHNLRDWRRHLDRLFAMRKAGELGAVGITTSHGRRHTEFAAVMASEPIDTVQLTYNPIDRAVENRLLPLAQERGLTVIVNRPFQRGALTRRLADAPLPGFAAELGATTWAQLILQFILSHPSAPIVIPATTRVAHVRENKAVEGLPRPDAAMRRRIAEAVAAAA